jgi:AcrR family transcriptional regulator
MIAPMSTEVIGRRERKKAQTRQTIADEALRLFVERDFDSVTVADIAEAADVSVSTLFKHFPSKEALIFVGDPAIESGFVRAVRERGANTSILDALRAYLQDAPDLAAGSMEFVGLVRRTPALTDYTDRMWSRHAAALAAAIADPPDVRTRAFARYVVEIPSIVRSEPDRGAAIDAVFDLLASGWGAA